MNEKIGIFRDKKIAILGATGHLAKGLIYNFSQIDTNNIFLFARSLERLENFLAHVNFNHYFHKYNLNEFNNYNFDVIINCVGLGTPLKVKEAGNEVFRLTETFDNMILQYLLNHPNTIYINFSSGAVYGASFITPVDELALAKWNINRISESDYYGIAKLNSEAKHRAMKSFNIVDLRIFGYFSRFIDLSAKYLLCEIISCIKSGADFATDQKNIMRDYIHPKDLFLLIENCVAKKNINDAFDAYSLKPVKKFEILDYFKTECGLKYSIRDNVDVSSITGEKDAYYSNNKRAQEVGYSPNFSSLDCIIEEARPLLVNSLS